MVIHKYEIDELLAMLAPAGDVVCYCAVCQARDALLAQAREIKYLRHYGNKDCTAMADEAMEKGELDK